MVDIEMRAVLLADATGSTRLFREQGDARAAQLIGECIDRMIGIASGHHGIFVHSRGDDLLCVFADPLAALRASREMLEAGAAGAVQMHAGLHWGPVILARDEAYGDAVNLAARLASLSNEGEALMSEAFAEQLPPAERAGLRAMDRMALKGMAEPVAVHALVMPGPSPATHMPEAGRRRAAAREAAEQAAIRLSHEGAHHDLTEGAECHIGRAPECDLVLPAQWVSRRHALITVRGGLVEYADRSSTGSYIRAGGAAEVFVRRQTVLLSASGAISPGLSAEDTGAMLIQYRVSPPVSQG